MHAFASPPRHHSEPPTEPSNYYSMSSRHVQQVVLKKYVSTNQHAMAVYIRTKYATKSMRSHKKISLRQNHQGKKSHETSPENYPVKRII
jgi:hypothetical protein